MNLKSILVLIVMLIWWIVCWKHYTCGIKNFCDSDIKTEIDSSKLQVPAFPISFNLNSDSALLYEFEVFRSDICSKYNGQTIEIVGSYFADGATFGVEKLAEVYAYSRALTLREVRTICRYRDSYYGHIA